MSLKKVLVIDNEQVMCDFLRDLFIDRGYTVELASTGGAGLDNFRNNPTYELVMVDLRMPDLDGIKVLEEIKKINSEALVIVITGYPSFETAQQAIRRGAYDYLTKPFNLEEVSFVIKRAFDWHNIRVTIKRLMQEVEEQNIKLEEKVKERTKELTLLYKINREISSSLNLDEVLQAIIESIIRILDVEICSILLYDKETKELSIKASSGLEQSIMKRERFKIGERISGWVLEHREALLVEDIEKDERFSKLSQEKYYTHSLISVPLIVKNEAIGVINVNNKRTHQPFAKDDLRFLKGVAAEVAISIDNAQLYTSLQDTYLHTVMALTSAIHAKDRYTQTHSEHVSKYAVAIAKEMRLAKGEVEHIRIACQLHDLGKIGIPDSILTKTEKLTPEEWEQMKLHSSKSAAILRPLSFLNGIITLVEQHHERFDGKGYPHSLSGENIELGARIMAVADSFDAMTTERPYKKALTKDQAMEELKQNSGTQFDPQIVDSFLRVLEIDEGLFEEVRNG